MPKLAPPNFNGVNLPPDLRRALETSMRPAAAALNKALVMGDSVQTWGPMLVTGTGAGSGGVTGSGVANQIPYWSGTSALGGSSYLVFNPANGDLTSAGILIGAKLQVTDATNPNIFDPSGRGRISLSTFGGGDGVNQYFGYTTVGPAHLFDNSATIGSNATLFDVRYLSGSRFTISRDGDVHVFGALAADGKITQPSTDSSGSPGPATINKPSGRSAIAAGVSGVTITNSVVTASSIVIVTPLDLDATLTSFKAVPGSGSFTVTGNANATAAWKFSWWVLN